MTSPEARRARRARGSDLSAEVDAARRGSVPAFERIYRELAPAVASYLRWNGCSDTESLTNEVMAQVHQRLHSFSGDGGGFRSWVFTIAHHRMVDDRRAAARRPLASAGDIGEEALVGDVEEEAWEQLGNDRMRGLIDGLSPDQREVVLLRVVGDLSLEDTANALGKQRGAIKSLQHRALATLRRQLEREGATA